MNWDLGPVGLLRNEPLKLCNRFFFSGLFFFLPIIVFCAVKIVCTYLVVILSPSVMLIRDKVLHIWTFQALSIMVMALQNVGRLRPCFNCPNLVI